jgi:hypothetical protein
MVRKQIVDSALDGVSAPLDADRVPARHHNWSGQVITEYEANNPARLIIDSVERADMAVGFRRLDALQAARDFRLLDLALWVERPSTPPDPTVEFTSSDCDISIVNDGGLEAFRGKLFRLASCLGLQPSNLDLKG